MKKVLESELLAQLRRDMVDAAVRMAHAEAELSLRLIEDDDSRIRELITNFNAVARDYRKIASAFEMVARENIATLPDEA